MSSNSKKDARTVSGTVQKVIREVRPSITPEESQQLAEFCRVMIDPVTEVPGSNCHHPNAAGVPVHVASAPSSSDLNYSNVVENGIVNTTAPYGSIVLALNNGNNRIARTAPRSTGLYASYSAKISQIVSAPGNGTITYPSGTISFASTGGTFIGGVMFDSSGSAFCQLPFLTNISGAPRCGYLSQLVGSLLGGATYAVNVLPTVGWCGEHLAARLWTMTPAGVWTTGNWVVNSTLSNPGVEIDYTITSSIYTAAAFAIEVDTTLPACFEACVSFNLKSGTAGGYPAVWPTSELALIMEGVEYWDELEFDRYVVLAAGEILTCTGTDLTAGGDVAVGIPASGTFPGDMPVASNYYNSLAKVVPHKYVGNLKFGASSYHIPQITDLLMYKDRHLINNFRMYAVRSSTTPTLQFKVDTLFNFTTSSAALSPVAGPVIGHFDAFLAVMGQLKRCGDNAGHMEKIKASAKKLAGWIQSPAGREALTDVGLAAKEAGKFVAKFAPLLLTFL